MYVFITHKVWPIVREKATTATIHMPWLYFTNCFLKCFHFQPAFPDVLKKIYIVLWKKFHLAITFLKDHTQILYIFMKLPVGPVLSLSLLGVCKNLFVNCKICPNLCFALNWYSKSCQLSSNIITHICGHYTYDHLLLVLLSIVPVGLYQGQTVPACMNEEKHC